MYYIDVPKRINQIILTFYLFGIWHADTRTNCRKWLSKILNLIAFIYYLVSSIVATILTDDPNEFMFLIVSAITISVLLVKAYYLLWKEDQFVKFISETGTHSFADNEHFNQVNGKIQIFTKLVVCLVTVLALALIVQIITALPIFTKTKRLPMNIYLPLDWKNNELFYWMAFVIIIYLFMLSLVFTLTNVILWYLMFSLAIKFQILETEFKQLGIVSAVKNKIQNLFYTDVIELVQDHQALQKTTEEFKSCFSMLFFIQIATSSLSLCSSVYLLAFTSVENALQFGVYAVVIMFNFFDIFVLTHLGNEIKLSSSRLSYCLFECNWIGQSESCKKCICILMEVLKRPQELVIGKLYALDYEILTQILKLAYSMLNILRNLK